MAEEAKNKLSEISKLILDTRVNSKAAVFNKIQVKQEKPRL